MDEGPRTRGRMDQVCRMWRISRTRSRRRDLPVGEIILIALGCLVAIVMTSFPRDVRVSAVRRADGIVCHHVEMGRKPERAISK